MMQSFRPSLTVSILAFLASLLLLTWILFSLFAFRTAANDLYAQKGEHARMLLATFVNQLPEIIPIFPLGVIPPDSPATIYAQKLADEPTFVRLSLLDVSGRIILTSGREGSDRFSPFTGISLGRESGLILPDGSGLTRTTTVQRNGEVVGTAGILLSLDAEKKRLTRSRQLFMAYFAIDFVLLLSLGSYILSRIVVAPLNRMLALTERITRGQYGQKIQVTGGLELARLAEAFNTMSDALARTDGEIKSHLAALEQANADLRQAREEAVHSEKMASIGLLAAGMAHEIGTPLASIMGYAELIAAETPDIPALQDYSRRIGEDGARIDRIVRGLLDYARPRGGEDDRADIREVIEQTVTLLAAQGVFKTVSLATSFDDQMPPAAVDAHQFQQVLINLILNGRDAMPDGGQMAVRVKYDSDRMGIPGLLVDVLDSGEGMSEERMRRIFDPFFTTKPPGRGTGLGLAISSRIIEGAGGRITVKSIPGKGSCFTVWLPVSAVNKECTDAF